MMTGAAYTVIFYLLAASAVVLALAVVHSRRLLRAAIYLMGVLVASAGLYIMLAAEFLAGIQVLVYVGGIVVLIVFAIMLTRSAELLEDHPSGGRQAAGAVAAMLFFALSAAILWTTPFALPDPGSQPVNDALLIGKQLLNAGSGGFVLAFELISLLLLAAAIGGIVVARKTPPPDQPFTSGGDQAGEADVPLPLRQRDALETSAAPGRGGGPKRSGVLERSGTP